MPTVTPFTDFRKNRTRPKGKDMTVEERPQFKYAKNYLDLSREAAVHLSSEEERTIHQFRVIEQGTRIQALT